MDMSMDMVTTPPTYPPVSLSLPPMSWCLMVWADWVGRVTCLPATLCSSWW